MGWRTLATMMAVVFAAILLWMTVAGPIVQVGDHFKDQSETNSNDLEPKGVVDSLISNWFNAILILVFGIMAWAAWFIYRKEQTRKRRF